MSAPRRLGLRLLLLLALPAGARAQQSLPARLADRFQPAASGVIGIADHRVDAGLGFERTSGLLLGVQVEATPLEGTLLSVRALGGALGAHTPSTDARDVGEIAATARMRLVPWLDARAGLTTRTFTSSLARQRWTSAAIGADLRMTMLEGRLEGTAGAQLLPFVRVSGHESPNASFGASMGLRYVARRYLVGLGYQLERYDFPSVADRRRLEEHTMLTLRAAYRFGRMTRATAD
ncbi:MAG: hypothetical protein HOQ11_01185 [Gemmatimonadaceae bacterium]|nr:hypothetical protein [Gemmatimonadaceae bacterium]NUQ93525.1 hypothetical protein [Gemmatimonadaceae bacterium]NUR18986.1 hypothetical protein [Gemmatimonadaceae bacterium]NUS96001.1 hypothetical protein [Gemmatimonadaceae bacterium]